ncbi:MAG: gamma-glutamylcyclotransferase family protein [Parachlamydiaceae bacterium]
MLNDFILKMILFSHFSLLAADLPKERLANLVETNNLANQYVSFKYPADPNQVIRQFPSGKVLIFGYGSLINPQSAARSLTPSAMRTYQPAIAFGMRRIFNRKMSDSNVIVKWGPLERASNVGMLNVVKSQNTGDLLNGVTFEVNKEDLASLIQRELGYDLVPIPVIFWEEAKIEPYPVVKIAYIFAAPDETRQGQVFVSHCINPVPGYALASKEGAALNGEEFLQLWLESTLLADGETTFGEWEKNPHQVDMSQGCKRKEISQAFAF